MTKTLIVDDEPLYRHGLFELLRRPNLKVDAAADGDEALRLFRRGGYQMVISDLSMPGLDGLGLMRAVKRESPSTRFVILSGVGTIQAALTAVRAARRGVIEQADGGTLFLDEIAEMPAVAQAKLLRVLQDKCVRRLGATTTQAINVRFIAATNRPLRAMVAERRFREDLYYRLDVMALQL